MHICSRPPPKTLPIFLCRIQNSMHLNLQFFFNFPNHPIARLTRHPLTNIYVGINGFGFPPKQMVGILMTHQHRPLDFDLTATIIIIFSGTLLFVAVGSKSNGPCWWVMRIPTICLGGDPNPASTTKKIGRPFIKKKNQKQKRENKII